MQRGLPMGMLMAILVAGCGESTAATAVTVAGVQTPAQNEVAQSPTMNPSELATATAAAAQATLVAARATVTASAGLTAAGTATAVAALPTRTATPALLSTAQIADIGRHGVVQIIAMQRGGGSGAYLGRDSVITANHVIDQAIAVSVLFDGKDVGFAQPVATSPEHDLALLRVCGLDAAGAVPLRWGDSSALRIGDELVVIGYPAVGLTVTRGILSAFKTIGTNEYLQTDATTNPGNSGGPVLNSRGQLVGVHVSAYRGSVVSGLHLSVAAKIARPFSESA